MSRTIDMFHWAAVSLIAALTSGVLSYAAGTPALAGAANVFCYVFAVLAVALAGTGILAWLAARGTDDAVKDSRKSAVK